MKTVKILRFPRLDTILMVEVFIKEFSGEYKKRALWEALPKKMMYQTFNVIVEYLLYSHKIKINKEGRIEWKEKKEPETEYKHFYIPYHFTQYS
ncbi:hypothetical protein AYK26_00455 [Euryarchaeota archaeon SM23-78]|nr:MAG: hypothetical protein AYK26_00455 [Euryarchaeota archaeon SM23-78]